MQAMPAIFKILYFSMHLQCRNKCCSKYRQAESCRSKQLNWTCILTYLCHAAHGCGLQLHVHTAAAEWTLFCARIHGFAASTGLSPAVFRTLFLKKFLNLSGSIGFPPAFTSTCTRHGLETQFAGLLIAHTKRNRIGLKYLRQYIRHSLTLLLKRQSTTLTGKKQPGSNVAMQAISGPGLGTHCEFELSQNPAVQSFAEVQLNSRETPHQTSAAIWSHRLVGDQWIRCDCGVVKDRSARLLSMSLTPFCMPGP